MRSHIITSEHEINYCDLVVLKPVTFSRTTKRYPLRINYNDCINSIILLTGNTGVNYGSYSYSNFTGAKYLDITYRRDTWEYRSITFINSSFQRISKLSKLVPRNYKFVSNVKTGDRITLKLASNFKTFDCCNNSKLNNDIIRGSIYRIALQPNSIWVSSITRQFGIEWNILQMRECGVDTSISLFPQPNIPPPPPPPPLAVPPLPPPNLLVGITYRNHPDYMKFFKMLSVGIPAQAVKNKMELVGVDPNILDTPDTIVNSNLTNRDNNRSALLSQIKGGISLRKVSHEESNKSSTDKDNGRVQINLNDIINARKSLKKSEEKSRPYWR